MDGKTDLFLCISVEPVRWFVELRFGNETFTSDLADPTSLAYNRFVYMKYYNLVCLYHSSYSKDSFLLGT